MSLLAIAATALTASMMLPAAGVEAPVPTSEVGVASIVDVTVEGSVMHLGWLGSSNVARVDCPAGGWLNSTEYHPGSGWRIPTGVELRTTGGPIDASIIADFRWEDGLLSRWSAAGGWSSSVTNWSRGDATVEMVLHCKQFVA